jgi:hypothetical protein
MEAIQAIYRLNCSVKELVNRNLLYQYFGGFDGVIVKIQETLDKILSDPRNGEDIVLRAVNNQFR